MVEGGLCRLLCPCQSWFNAVKIENHTENDRDMDDKKEKIDQIPFTGADGHVEMCWIICNVKSSDKTVCVGCIDV